MRLEGFAVVWFLEEDWTAWLTIDAEIDPDYGAWRQRVEQQIADLAENGYTLHKVVVRPSDFLRWAHANGRQIYAQDRAAYAAWMLGKSDYG